jgi:hypothetical protein
MIVTHKPRSNNHIAAVKPVIAYFHTGEVPGPLHALYVSFVSIIQIMITRNKINLFKVIIEMFQCPETVVQCDNVQAGTVVVPVTQEHASFATFFPGFGSGPFYKSQTVFVV